MLDYERKDQLQGGRHSNISPIIPVQNRTIVANHSYSYSDFPPRASLFRYWMYMIRIHSKKGQKPTKREQEQVTISRQDLKLKQDDGYLYNVLQLAPTKSNPYHGDRHQ
jgi:hypothetical protein